MNEGRGMASFLDGKTVLVTGGTGSFGKHFVKKVIKTACPRRLIVFSRDELKQFEMQQWANAPIMRYFLGDVRDMNRLQRAFNGVDVVIHAAAMKQVPASETNPMEAIRTNVLGAENVLNAAMDNNVSHVLALSTDKACNPVNLYGATKLCSDKLIIAANGLASNRKTKLSVVRYGNVIGSRGSVIPFFMEKRKTGVIPITDPKMTRFMITLEQAVDFVLKSLERMQGGELFVPKIPSMNLMDIKDAIAPECDAAFIGIRPGEKIHEMMISQDDVHSTVEFDDHYVIQPQATWWKRDEYLKSGNGRPVPMGFEYVSDKNSDFLTKKGLLELLKQCPLEVPDSKTQDHQQEKPSLTL